MNEQEENKAIYTTARFRKENVAKIKAKATSQRETLEEIVMRLIADKL